MNEFIWICPSCGELYHIEEVSTPKRTRYKVKGPWSNACCPQNCGYSLIEQKSREIEDDAEDEWWR